MGYQLSFGCLFNEYGLEISVKEVCILQMFYIEVYAGYLVSVMTSSSYIFNLGSALISHLVMNSKKRYALVDL